MSFQISPVVISLIGLVFCSVAGARPAMAQPPAITITAPTGAPAYTAPGAAITLEGTTTGDVTSVVWSSDRGESGTASGASPWYATDVPLVAGTNVLTVTATGPGGSATDTLTVTVTTLSYILAEGATGAFFDFDLALANPNETAAPVAIAYFKEDGTTVSQSLTLPPTSSRVICVDCIAGLESTALSTVVTSTAGLPLVVERTLRWSDEGQYGSHTEKATSTTALRWYFAEGSQGFFFTYLLLANPGASANRATVDWLLEGAPAVRRVYDLAPQSRTTIDAGADAALVNRSFGIVVSFDLPGAAERAMYFGTPPDLLFKAGHESAGVTGPSTSWFLPEGATGPFFETFLLLANPHPASATATLTFLPAGGTPVVRAVTIPGHGRQTVNLEALSPAAPTLANAAVATTVTATLPIVVERAQYWPASPFQWYEAHNGFGVTMTGTRWGLAEGRVGNPVGLPPANYQTYILLANPAGAPAQVAIRFLRRDGTTVSKAFSVAGTSRLNVAVAGGASHVPELANETFGAVVTSDQPIVVERAMYGDAAGLVWSAGSNASATRLPPDGLLFEDRFGALGSRLDLAAWTTERGSPSFLGRTQLADWVTDWVTPGGVGRFVVGAGGAELRLDTHNPTGFSLYGTHGKTLRSFQPTGGSTIELTTRLRLTSLQRGLVYGVYFFGCPGPCATRHDEIDIELVTNLLQPGGPLQVQLNRYADEPLGAGHGALATLPVGFDPLAEHDWTIRWSLNRIEYLVDGTLLAAVTDHVPQGPMQVNQIPWGPGMEWAAAFDASLQPASAAGQNQSFVALVRAVTVRRLS